jgi:hypothetical protein
LFKDGVGRVGRHQHKIGPRPLQPFNPLHNFADIPGGVAVILQVGEGLEIQAVDDDPGIVVVPVTLVIGFDQAFVVDTG